MLHTDLARLVARQAGVIATRQAVAVGVPSSTLADRARRERWRRPHRGVWLVAGHPWTPEARCWAAVLAGGPDALLTGAGALAIHRVRARVPSHLRVVVPRGRARPRRSGDVTVATTRRPVASRRVDGMPVAAPIDALLDVAAGPTPLPDLRDDVIVAVQRRLVVADVAALDLPVGAPGRPRLVRAHHEACARGPDSPLTLRVLRGLLGAGVDLDPLPRTVRTHDGALHPDLTLRERCVAIECDGLAHHGRQADLAVDHRKDRRYQLADWTVLRIGWWEFEHGWTGFLRDVQYAARSVPTS